MINTPPPLQGRQGLDKSPKLTLIHLDAVLVLLSAPSRSRLCQEQKDVAPGFFSGASLLGGGGVRRCPPKNERVFFLPNFVGAFKVVLAGSRLGKPGVFNQRGSTNHVLTVLSDSHFPSFWTLRPFHEDHMSVTNEKFLDFLLAHPLRK